MKYIYSKYAQKGLLIAEGVNVIGDLFGLIGVYIKNELHEKSNDENTAYNILTNKFEEQYLNDDKKHGIRNIGEKDIKSLLYDEGYDVSRIGFRFFSETWRKFPVVSYLESDLIFNKTIERVHDNPILWKVACEKIFQFNDGDDCIEKMLDFQYTNLCCYLIGAESIKRRKFRKMFENWRNNIIVKYLGK